MKTKKEGKNSNQFISNISSNSFSLADLFLLGVSGIFFFVSCRLIYGRFTSINSTDATINGVVVDLRAPSPGKVTRLSKETGVRVVESEKLAVIVNERASKLLVQELEGKLNEQKRELAKAKAHLDRQNNLLQILQIELGNQRRLQVVEAKSEMRGSAAKLEEAELQEKLAQKKYDREAYLVREGVISRASADLALSQLKQRQAELENSSERLQQLSANKDAAELGLSLERSISNYDPKTRLQELEINIAAQHQTIDILQRNIKDTQDEFEEAKNDFSRERKAILKTPISGIVWRLDARLGEFLEEGDSLGAVLDCKRKWVDVYVDEKVLRSLEPGTIATVEPYGTKRKFRGRIALVRSGLGRSKTGEDVAIPLKSNLPRQSQVRVEFEPGTEVGESENFCYVGYSARVRFERAESI